MANQHPLNILDDNFEISVGFYHLCISIYSSGFEQYQLYDLTADYVPIKKFQQIGFCLVQVSVVVEGLK